MTATTPHLRIRRHGCLGHIELQRPKALNALSLDMILGIHQQLSGWEQDASIRTVLLSGHGGRAFCAGSDVKQIAIEQASREKVEHEQQPAHFVAPQRHTNFAPKKDRGKPGTLGADLFRAEYALDGYISSYTKPIVSYLDGITMGGGLGIAMAGTIRIATEKTRLAMPEAGIGFIPDAGATHFLGNAGPPGLLMALTGCTVDGPTGLQLGLATHYGPAEASEALISVLAHCQTEDDLHDATNQFCRQLDTPLHHSAAPFTPFVKLSRNLRLASETNIDADIEAHADSHTPWRIRKAVLRFLETEARAGEQQTDLAEELLELLTRRCPTSQLVTIEQFRRGRDMDYLSILRMEYRISQASLARDDFYEGIRAALIDKDHNPNWNPADPAEVTRETIDDHFCELDQFELTFPA